MKGLLNSNISFSLKEDNIYCNSIILEKELEKWYSFSFILRKPNRDLFNQVLRLSYKYSEAIAAKGENDVTESLLMSLSLEQQYKIK